MKIKIKGSLIELVKDVSLVQDPKIPYIVDFSFNEEWEHFRKTALFKADKISASVVLADGRCAIPAECLKKCCEQLQIAVVGTKDSQQISTGWCVTGLILPKLNLGLGQGGGSSILPDDAYEQVMSVIGDFSAAGFEGKTLSEVIIELRKNISGTATDKEVEDMLDIAFGSSAELSENTAVDKETDTMLDEVFGK